MVEPRSSPFSRQIVPFLYLLGILGLSTERTCVRMTRRDISANFDARRVATMRTFLLLAISVIAILLCKIVVLVYNTYITRKKLSHIPGPISVPFIGTLSFLLQTEQEEHSVQVTLISRLVIGRVDWVLSLLHKFKDGIFQIWIGPQPIIYLYKPELLKTVLASTVFIEKSVHYDFYKEWMGNGLLTSSGKQWVRDRKLLSPSFHFNILEQFGAIISEKIEIMLKQMEKKIAKDPRKAINIIPIIEDMTFEIVFDTILNINEHTRKDKTQFITNVRRLLKLISIRINQPWFWVNWIYNLSPMGREYKKLIHNLHEFTRDIIQTKQLVYNVQNDKSQSNCDDFETAAKRKRKTLLELLLDLSKNENNMLTMEDLKSQLNTFIFASYDTTATTLCWALYCLGNNLDHQEKVHKELEEVFQDSQEPASVMQLSQLKYLDRVMKESIRLYPTVPSIARKIRDNINIDDWVIPKDSTVLVSIMLLHRNPAVWPNPLKFDPDRFLPENMRYMHPYSFIPFSTGPRNCIGQRFALLEEKIILTAILRKWRVKSVDTPAEITLFDGAVLRPYQQIIRMHLSPRKEK
ncbi:cytochrome P450 4C1 isoform X2 [Harpegnathos saltator]|uniref:cytochrome P450 4C1 isoform X2 n=1 Tax=Harpegnathos saltator TaxID=610380 RepID=UPI000DBEF175|nr:cytochrome P450 4C1 isoform X2 [Harpegnathos saltator]